MSEFSERCKQLLAECGSNVYQIAKHSTLDRTSLQRMTTGKRLPNEQFVKDFCNYLRISPIEKAELLELYKMEKIGKATYQRRWYVKSLIEALFSSENSLQIAEHNFTLRNHLHEHNLQNLMHLTNATILEHVEETILNALEEELTNNETPEILLNIPSNYLFLFHALQKTLKNTPKETRIKHLITLNKNTSNTEHSIRNLETLSHILPVAKALDGRYRPYYIYSNLTQNDEKILVMPYYIVTSKHLLIISSDFKSVSVHTYESIIKDFRNEFLRIFDMAEPLIKYTILPNEILSYLHHTYMTLGKPTYSFEFHPCFLYMSSTFQLPETFTRGLTNIDELAPLFYEMFQPLSNSNTISTNFFSEEGLHVFSTTGKCLGQYNNIEEGFSITERKLMLNQYCNKNMNEEFHGYMLKPCFKVPTYVNIELHDTHCLHLFSLKENFECSFIEIQESSICETFYDFFKALPDSELTYSKEETYSKMQNYLTHI